MRTLKESGILVLISIATAITVHCFSPVGIAWVGKWDTEQGVVKALAKNDNSSSDLEIGDLGLARKMFDSGSFLFVDARSRSDYEAGHIKGSVSLPIGQFDDEIFDFLDKYPPETSIVAYCSGRNCEDSHRLAEHFLDFGYTQVRVMIDGYPGWKAEGYPVE
jgi:rhodanese-related sulfurtransferase